MTKRQSSFTKRRVEGHLMKSVTTWLRWRSNEQAPCSVTGLFVFWSNLIDIIPQWGAIKTWMEAWMKLVHWSLKTHAEKYDSVEFYISIAPPLDFLKVRFVVPSIRRETDGFSQLSSLKKTTSGQVYSSSSSTTSPSSSKRRALFQTRCINKTKESFLVSP